MVLHIGRTLSPAASPINLRDILSGVAGIFEGRGIINMFEDELKSFFNVRYVFTVSSGKAALVLILKALNELFPERDEVLIPAYTCYSVPSAIVRAGFKVRLCDMAPDTLDFDFDRIVAELDNPKLLCVIPTHLFGMPSNVERLKSLINKRDIFVLEDAAQAMGNVFNGKKLGTLGDAGLFSLGRGKAFSTVEGGIILTDHDQIGRILEKQLASIKGYGILDCLKLFVYAAALSVLVNPVMFWLPKSLPFLRLGETRFNPSFPIRRMSSFQAGMAKKWKTTVNKFKMVRSINANKIARFGIMPAAVCPGTLPDLIRFPVLVSSIETKKRILWNSERMGLGIADGYPDTIDGIEDIRSFFGGHAFPVARDISERIVTFPVHPYVSDSDVNNMVRLFR